LPSFRLRGQVEERPWEITVGLYTMSIGRIRECPLIDAAESIREKNGDTVK